MADERQNIVIANAISLPSALHRPSQHPSREGTGYSLKTAHDSIPHYAEEPDIAVFRFTLGIPGFDDADIPRILGFLALALLAANNISSNVPPDGTQVCYRFDNSCSSHTYID